MDLYSSKSAVRISIAFLLLLHIEATSSSNKEEQLLLEFATRMNSTQKPRICQIYSRSTKKHIQIFNKKVVARGADGDEYSKVEKTSYTFGVVTIRGVKTRRYLCVSPKGKLVARKSLSRDGSCRFRENITPTFWTAFKSDKYPDWYVGFYGKGKSTGKGKRGHRTSATQPACNFLIRSQEKIPPVTTPQNDLVKDYFRRIRLIYMKPHSSKRIRRHKDTTVAMMHHPPLPKWITSPPSNASPEEMHEWILRVKNYNRINAPWFDLNETLHEFDGLTRRSDIVNFEPEVKTGRRKKGRKRGKEGREKRKREKTSPTTMTSSQENDVKIIPTTTPAEKKFPDVVTAPKTPVLRHVEKEDAGPPTVPSPFLRKQKGGKRKGGGSRSRNRPVTVDYTNILTSEEEDNLNSNNGSFSDPNNNNFHKDDFSRTLEPSLTNKVASSRRTKSRRGRGQRKTRLRKKPQSSEILS